MNANAPYHGPATARPPRAIPLSTFPAELCQLKSKMADQDFDPLVEKTPTGPSVASVIGHFISLLAHV